MERIAGFFESKERRMRESMRDFIFRFVSFPFGFRAKVLPGKELGI